jgi:hypothetical protein
MRAMRVRDDDVLEIRRLSISVKLLASSSKKA